MGSMLNDWARCGMSAGLGLPEDYGLLCILAGVLMVAGAAYFLPVVPESGKMRKTLDAQM